MYCRRDRQQPTIRRTVQHVAIVTYIHCGSGWLHYTHVKLLLFLTIILLSWFGNHAACINSITVVMHSQIT
jgi:hypothetical protein